MAVREKRRGRDTAGELALIAGAVWRFLAAALYASGRVGGTMAPFGVAAVAASGTGLGGVSALAGACLGYLATGGAEQGIRSAAACVAAFTIMFIFQDAPWAAGGRLAPFAALGVTLLSGALGCLASPAPLAEAIASVAAEALLAALAAYFFRVAAGEGERESELAEKRHAAALVISAAAALTGLARLELFGALSLGRVTALLCVMAASLKGGSFAGAAAGTAFGLAMDAAALTPGTYTAAYAFPALCAGLFSRFGRLAFLSVFVSSGALAAYFAGGLFEDVTPLFEAFAASVIFMLLPPGLLSRAAAPLQPMSPGLGESGLRRYAARRAESISRAYLDVYGAVERCAECVNDNDVARVFDRAADAACVKCRRRDECWGAGYAQTLDALNSATASMLERGRLEAEDIPAWFRENCRHMDAFTAAVNGELRAQAMRAQFAARLRAGRMTAWGQYRDFAAILAGLSRELGSVNGADPLAERRLTRYLRSLDIEADAAVFRDSSGRLRAVIESGAIGALTRDPAWLDRLSAVLGVRLCHPDDGAQGRLTLLEAEPLCVSVGVAALKKAGESVSGDRGTYFKTDAGVLCVILSDGMGAGEDAAGGSVEAVGILERFLRGGVEPDVAMKILNGALLLKNEDEWGFATVDLMCVDLFSGEAGFYKYGAAPSYVRSGKSVRRIDCESLAAGMAPGEGAAPDAVHMVLRPGSVAVIASDGVAASADDAWLRELIAGSEATDMKALARRVLRRAAELFGRDDDMTVLALRVDARP